MPPEAAPGTGRKILVTRPLPDAQATAAALRAMGHVPLVSPMLDIRASDAGMPDNVRAIILTSRNAARCIAGTALPRDLPVLAVGDATAQIAREAGFLRTRAAGGDVAALEAQIGADPALATLCWTHIRGVHTSNNLAENLRMRGFACDEHIAYEAVAATMFAPETHTELARGAVDGALFFSPRTAEIFRTLADEAGLTGEALANMEFFCLSDKVARALAGDVQGQAYACNVRVAKTPDQAALLALIDRL